MKNAMQQIVHKKVFCSNPVGVGFLSTFKTELSGKWRVTIKTGSVLHVKKNYTFRMRTNGCPKILHYCCRRIKAGWVSDY
jgi:hypothetical protein